MGLDVGAMTSQNRESTESRRIGCVSLVHVFMSYLTVLLVALYIYTVVARSDRDQHCLVIVYEKVSIAVSACPLLRRILHLHCRLAYRPTTCLLNLDNLEMSGILTAFRDMSGI